MSDDVRVKFSALTPVTNQAQVMPAINALIANLTPLVGQHKNKNERAVQWSDMLSLGLANVKGLTEDGYPDYGLPPAENPDMTAPPAIVNFSVEASFNFVTLSWDQPRYRNHAYVEVWRAPGFKKLPDDSEVPTTRSDAVFRLMTASIVCSDTVLPGDKWRYWARNVSSNGVPGEWTSVDGHLAEVPEDPGYLIDKISGEIREGDLYPALGEKIDTSYTGVIEQGALINAAWTVRIDSGNAVSGFGLMVDGTTGRSDFIIRSDRFAIAAPQAYDQNGKPIVNTAAFPFIVDVTNPASPKVLIKNAYIDQAFIQTLVTGSLVADRITGQTLTGTHIRGGDMAIGSNFSVDSAGSATMLNAFIRGTIQSSNYGAGVSGWQIHNNGNAEFNNAVLRGTIYATGGWFQGTVYAEKMVGGAYTKKNYSGWSQADSADTGWRTATRVTVARGMGVSRKVEIFGSAGHYNMMCKVESSGSSPLTRTLNATYEVRIVRDGGVVEAWNSLSYSLSATSNPSSGPVTTYSNGGLGVSLVANVPADGGTHYYELQFRFVRIGGDAGAGSTATAGCSPSDGSTAVMYIENGDLT